MKDDNVQLTTLSENPEFTKEVVYYVWNEWSHDYIQHTDIVTRELLEIDIQYSSVYIIYNPRTHTLLGFCFIEEHDSLEDELMNQLHPWLSNVYILEPYRKKGYGTTLLRHVLSNYKERDLYLWTKSKAQSLFYEKLGFQLFSGVGPIFVMKLR